MREVIICGLTILASMGEAATVVRGHGRDIRTFSPHDAITHYEQAICYDLFSGLVQLDARGKIVPGIAESWEKSADGRTYVFFLRSAALARWSDGSPVTAEDFVASFQRLADPRNASPYQFLVKSIKNGEAILQNRCVDLNALGVRARDKYILEIKLERPFLHFIQMLTHVGALPYKSPLKAAWGNCAKLSSQALITNGAYCIKEFRPGLWLRLQKNPYYWNAAAVHLPEIIYYLGADATAEIAMFRRQDLEVTWYVPPEKIAALRQKFPQQLQTFALPGVLVLLANTRTSALTQNQRQALSLALDREKIVRLNKLGELPAYTLLPPKLASQIDVSLPYKNLSYGQCVHQAVNLLRASGVSLKRVRLLADMQRRRQALAIAQLWTKTLGIQVDLELRDWHTYCQMLRDKKFDIAIVAIICDYNDSLALLSLFAEADSGVNFGGYNNPEYTRCITKATHALTESERQGYLRSALSQLLEDHMVIPVYFPRVARLVQERLRGYVANFLDIHPSQYLSCVAMTPDRTLS